MAKELSIVEMRAEIKTQVMDSKETFNALARNTFKGLEAELIPQVLLEGMMRGFTIQDFMIKNVYAIQFWNSKEQRQDYALVTSIDHARKVGARSGQSGKSAPAFTMAGEKIESCSVTVYKKDGDERGYTATVFFEEYEKKPKIIKLDDGTTKEIPGMWQTKPRTMIAKVAEMHSLRMAFPEEFDQLYLAEEFDREREIHTEPVVVVDEAGIKKAITEMNRKRSVDSLQACFTALEPNIRKENVVIDVYKDRMTKLTKPKKIAAPKKKAPAKKKPAAKGKKKK